MLGRDPGAVSILGRPVRHPVLTLFSLALVLRVVWLLVNRPVPVSDFSQYYQLARDLLQHGQFGYPNPTLKRLPGFPWFLSCLMFVSQSPLWLGAVTSLLSSGLVVLVYVFALDVTRQQQTALLAAALCAASPTFVAFAGVLGSEHLSIPLTLASLILASRYATREALGLRAYALVVAAGLCLGAATLTRGESVFYVPVVLAVVGMGRARRLRKAATGILLVLVGVAVVVAPWYQRNAAIDERAGLSTTSGLNFYLAHNPTGYGRYTEKDQALSGLSEVELNQQAWRLGWRHVRKTHLFGLLRSTGQGTLQLFLEPPLYAVKWSTVTQAGAKKQTKWNARLAYRAPGYAMASAFYYALLVLSCIAWRYKKRLFEPATRALLGVVLMNWACYAVVFWGKARYRYLVELLFCVLAAITLQELIRARQRARSARSGALRPAESTPS